VPSGILNPEAQCIIGNGALQLTAACSSVLSAALKRFHELLALAPLLHISRLVKGILILAD
jgi:adenylosuccinate synthase